jgi:hypothetical protein
MGGELDLLKPKKAANRVMLRAGSVPNSTQVVWFSSPRTTPPNMPDPLRIDKESAWFRWDMASPVRRTTLDLFHLNAVRRPMVFEPKFISFDCYGTSSEYGVSRLTDIRRLPALLGH